VATQQTLKYVLPPPRIANYLVRQTDRMRLSASLLPKTLNVRTAIAHAAVRPNAK